MTISDFARKAYEGGWQPHYIDVKHSDHWFGFSEDSSVCIPQMMLDVSAWQAVGKTEGWKVRVNGLSTWHWNMHRMIDALAEGKTLEQFIETL